MKITKKATSTTATVAFTCQTCGGSRFEELGVLPDQQFDGRLIRRQYVRCDTCQQVGVRRSED